ncbi:hypothetical protein F4778DRAFT_797454 [Xylariomycetidae sp. FL2044]|nr:hypothetical protein F4778DRAFT_797454 [Xylariomycetidae sp. FL2044]
MEGHNRYEYGLANSSDSNTSKSQAPNVYTKSLEPGLDQRSTFYSQLVPRERHHVLRFWTYETISMIMSFGLIAATFSILARYDGQKVPEWPFSINLNGRENTDRTHQTLIALLATILRATMLVAVAEVISQAKWAWISKPRSLGDLQVFDQASRTVSGSFWLLSTAPKSTLGAVGAVVTILSLAIGPFTQQAIKNVGCLQEHPELRASIPLANFAHRDDSLYRAGAGSWEVQADMKGTMVNGIVNPLGNDTAIKATCPTGNCTFTAHNDITHSSIAMCSACINTSPLVRDPSGMKNLTLPFKTNLTLPNLLWVNPLSDMNYINIGADNLSWAESAFTPEFLAVAPWALTNVTVLTLTQSSCSSRDGVLTCPHNISDGYSAPMDYLATSCSLYPCMKSYNATLQMGVLDEKVISTEPATLNTVEANKPDPASPSAAPSAGLNVEANYTAVAPSCLVDGQWYDRTNLTLIPAIPGRTFTPVAGVDGTTQDVADECLYKMMYTYGSALNAFMDTTLFAGSCTYNRRQGDALLCEDKWWLSALYRNKTASYATLDAALDQFATVVTNRIRAEGASNYGDGGDPAAITRQHAQGLVQEMTVCTRFEWEWLLLPLLLTVGAAAMLAAMVAQNLARPDQPVWKSSVLPLLFYGFDHADVHGQRHHHEEVMVDSQRPAVNLDQLERVAKGTTVAFRNGADTRFVEVEKM